MRVSNSKEFFKKRGIVGVIGGLWAMIPDMDHFLTKPVFKNASWTDVFLFHASFDKVLPETDLFFAAEMLLLFAVINLFAMVASVESFKRLKEALFGREEEEEEDEDVEEEEVIEEGEEKEVDVGEGEEAKEDVLKKQDEDVEEKEEGEEGGEEEENVEEGEEAQEHVSKEEDEEGEEPEED